ncbi:hypothetical protein [Vibrio sp. 1288]|uniref:hypothetical protein n=1 Tax=Vibrio sp. 1288 TaxID=3074550 RepID=UPI002966F185|nr:hypothetical protein [Vibrio sp. 1288]MDW3137697.1 hypothetical protein [Vibrio sp. 1288]
MFKQLISWCKSLYKKENINSHSNTSYQLETQREPEQESETTNRIERERVTLSPELLAEKNKVRNRLELWAKRQNQINSRILNAYLTLERKGYTRITTSMISNQLRDIQSFQSNFNQMKTIAPHNHAKVFEVSDDVVTIWPVVEIHVRDYERKVFVH